MSENIDLKNIQRKAWRSFFHDGLLDIYLGLLLMVTGIAALLFPPEVRRVWHCAIYFAVLALAFVVFWAGKRFVAIRRLGRVRYGPALEAKSRRQTATTVTLMLAEVAVVVIAVMAIRGYAGAEPALGKTRLIALGVGVCTALLSSLGSYLMDFARGYVIGVLYALGLAGTILLDNPIMLVLAGAAVLLLGLLVFLRFLRKYPVPAAQEAGAQPHS